MVCVASQRWQGFIWLPEAAPNIRLGRHSYADYTASFIVNLAKYRDMCSTIPIDPTYISERFTDLEFPVGSRRHDPDTVHSGSMYTKRTIFA